ncbi:MAG TPA: peptidylprolyl isomerase [Oligoflexia bacterium]|nr:peptidylprolyl isomerase [Oligoflexia bacterium]
MHLLLDVTIMHTNTRFLLMGFLMFSSHLIAKSKPDHLKTLLIETSMGNIEVSLSHKSKQTSEAFIKLVESGAFNLDGNSFYRVVTPQNDTYIASDQLREKGIGVIQGGIEFVDSQLKSKISAPQIINDFETTKESGLLHKPGAFALGRSFQDSSASLSEFFIDVEGDLEELNANTVRYKNYAPKDTLGLPVIGHVTKGMKLVKKIYGLNKKLTDKNQMLKCLPSKDKPCVDKDYSVKIIKMSIKP